MKPKLTLLFFASSTKLFNSNKGNSSTVSAYYAPGAGLGHLTRAAKVIRALKLPKNTYILSNSRFIPSNSMLHFNAAKTKKSLQTSFQEQFLKHFINTQLVALPQLSNKNKPQYLLSWLNAFIEKHNIQHLIIDSFPVGIQGELNGLSLALPELPLSLIARSLKWSAYKPLIKRVNNFSQCYLLEELTVEYQEFLQNNAQRCAPIKFPAISTTVDQTLPGHIPKTFCAVVHAGPQEELEVLIHYAQQRLALRNQKMSIVLVSPEKLARQGNEQTIIHYPLYPALPLLKKAEVVVSGAGFNILDELFNQCQAHWALPFERRFDDQFLRAEKYYARRRLYKDDSEWAVPP